jgi:Fe-S-cluster containining protein
VAASDYDCTRCGACCTNPAENRAEGFVHYVEVEPDDAILQRQDLVRKLVVRDGDGVPHLRLDRDGRCLALRGRLGDRVKCIIYHERPRACRRVEVGSDAFRRARRDAGLPA